MSGLRYEYNIFADYFQFYLEDGNSRTLLANGLDWNQVALDNLLIANEDMLAIGTVRNVTVPVIIEIWDEQPDNEDHQPIFDQADHVNECSLRLFSGILVVMGCTDYYPEAPHIKVVPSIYRARIYYSNLDSLRENGLAGDDSYHVVLFPDSHIEFRVLKKRKYDL